MHARWPATGRLAEQARPCSPLPVAADETLWQSRFIMSAQELVAELEKLDESALAKFVEELQKHHDLAEDLYNLLAFRMRADEPSRPFGEFMRALPQKR
jgi:hypothetical protein